MNDSMKTFYDIFKKAKAYYFIALVSSLYISFKADPWTGFFANIILNCFASVIGLNEVLLDIKTRLVRASTSLNNAHFDQLVHDTESLRMIEKNLLEARDINGTMDLIRAMINGNNQIINKVKTLINGVEQ